MGMNEGGVSTPGLRLYHLDQDIGETTDVAAQHPAELKKPKALADRMAATLCDGSANGPGVRPPGKVDRSQFLYPVTETAQKKGKKAASGQP